MNQNDVANTRLILQQITATKFKTDKEIVGWMGAMQAQDFNMAKWAIGLRLKNETEQNIGAAINSGEIIRTHLLRPTWHFVSANDIYWMIELTALRIKSFMKGRNIQLELSENIFKKANTIIIETNFYNQQNKDAKQIQKEAEKFGYFLNHKAEIILK